MKKKKNKPSRFGWSVKLKYDGVPIIDLKGVKDDELDGLLKEAKRKSG